VVADWVIDGDLAAGAGGGLCGLAKAQASFDDPGLVWHPIIQ
jgi:hypothetical protein